ncbi:MAG: ADP-L-glycero-D-manno-heptose-6-epimerase [Chlamydiia bacterium]|nr:ADP-L-glycero-D-manno-heptose-6-epimerase [Chlamydiia bacterium]MCH9616178.1 ADP-L-glycero-D-manno-heptose-6-epimerase [Chlamydiia bacterium]MCH9629836.1 ADP-L-glycero-D-manno-heptose-6-epimerase [Chlamydiia bacterium]
MSKVILVTGSSGWLGSPIAQALGKIYSVIGVDVLPGPFTTHVVDIRSKDIVELIKRANVVIHTAALHAKHVGINDDKTFWDINVQGTENLLAACLENQVEQFIFSSSTSIYGHALVSTQQAVWVTEDLTPEPRDVYDETKLAAENLCKKASSFGALSCLCLRISRCFLEEERLMAIYRLYRGIDIQDVVLAHKLAITSGIKGFEALNISNQTPFLASDVEELFYRADHVIEKLYPLGAAVFRNRGWELPRSIDRVYVIEKAKRLLGFHPTYNFLKFLKSPSLV